MKISLDSAMRARDVSQPHLADEEAAELAEAAIAGSRPVKTEAANGKRPAGAADLGTESGRSGQQPPGQQPPGQSALAEEPPARSQPVQLDTGSPDYRGGGKRGRSRRRATPRRRGER
ncbi:MAG TPA: hypothetical protein VMB74_17835 [Streptosporangiaceae bacterium]|nr:hypothetical protein [Streptosporangiaceae bacterium]